MFAITKKNSVRAAAAVVALAAFGMSAPQASAGEVPAKTELKISAKADDTTRAIAEEETAAVLATGNLCGSSYQLYYAERLPDATRLGTLFVYNQTSGDGVCAIFDNNTGTAKYMKVKVCDYKTTPTCVTDEGTFSQYAGPVRMNVTTYCATVIAVMKTSKSATTALIDRKANARPCN
ncbi:hypothetical protein G6045_08485 [Streptomyces sp. YC504]|uniref:Spore-associated protein A n=1 Tax=Streptomyces mesophilus TaxID=1775132 RepID=A0A6G4XDV5_9ACTN|nr:hypothetical protein [Streptomyces mesophilus]NGO75715.1 hypothetical protein [Streptomyces mesophilus]